MNYSSSKSKYFALKKIKESYKQVIIINELHKSSSINYDIQQMTFQSAIIIACASLEQYMVSFIDDWFIQLEQNKAKFKHIPLSLKTYFLMQQQIKSIRTLIAYGDEMKYVSETILSNDYYIVHNPNKSIKSVSVFRNFKLYENKSFPSDRNIKKIFTILGQPKIFEELRSISNISFLYLLTSFLDVRNAIAHRQAPDLTISDMEKHFRNIRRLIRYIDMYLFTHICQISESRFWPSALSN
ncbi:HEPN domain-containing protein [Hymenobacter pini]|uniref:HEPN domain-containing protein n=1 Tax=Hymenobacter pini TaxID=2880879 RepID=UPI001CF3DC9C|nr:HEPN domain-containing protein [Hymenobacter pini]MCA8830310.1 hypothetical protein [Hymenobacter pini]